MALMVRGRSFLDWLEGDDSDRQRFREMHDRFRDAWVFGVLIGGCTVLTAASYGWWIVWLPVFASLVMLAGVRAHPHSRHPEVVGMVTFSLLELDLALSVLLTGGGASPLLSLMVVPVFTQAVAFRPRVTIFWVALSAGLAVIVVVGAARFSSAPRSSMFLEAVSYLALLGCLALAAHYLASADVHSRDEAAQDALTGLLNRKALESRFEQVASRLRSSGEPLTLLMVDVDHFKKINDSHGHQQGDVVLSQLAQRLIGSVRPADLVFRVGGEEFLVLMPGLDPDTARFAAERLHRAVSGHPVAGLSVTVSVGVASGRDDGLHYGRMLQAADGAMYRAKQDGRNCVRLAA